MNNPQTRLVPKLRFPEFRGAGAWEPTTLGEESSILKGKGISKADLDPNGAQPCIRYGELYTRYGETIKEVASRTAALHSGLFLSQRNDVIIPSSGETKIDIAKASCVLAANIALGGDLNVIRSKLNGTFLSYYLNGPKRFDIAKVAQGDTVVHLYPHQLEALRIAYPSPAEQQKIADCLSSLDELIAAQTRKVEALKTHKKGLMQQLFPREGETQPRLRFPEFQNADKWGVSELGSISDVRDGTHDSPSFFQTGRPLVTSKNLRPDGTLDLENVSLISEDDYEQINKRSKVSVGDILFGMIGTIGNPVQIKSAGFAIKNVALIKEDGSLSNAFLVQLLQSGYAVAIFAVLNTGNSQKFIALGKIRGLQVPFPSTREQQRIAACLSNLDTLITAATQELDTLKTHKKGLMQQLFPSVGM